MRARAFPSDLFTLVRVRPGVLRADLLVAVASDLEREIFASPLRQRRQGAECLQRHDGVVERSLVSDDLVPVAVL
jgi:hypothetical protein